MMYPIKTLSQLPQLLKSFRKKQGLTQVDMGEKLGITQQSYAFFEANPASAPLERLILVLRLLDVELSLSSLDSAHQALVAPRGSEHFTQTADHLGKLSEGLMAPRFSAEFAQAAAHAKQLNDGAMGSCSATSTKKIGKE